MCNYVKVLVINQILSKLQKEKYNLLKALPAQKEKNEFLFQNVSG